MTKAYCMECNSYMGILPEEEDGIGFMCMPCGEKKLITVDFECEMCGREEEMTHLIDNERVPCHGCGFMMPTPAIPEKMMP